MSHQTLIKPWEDTMAHFTLSRQDYGALEVFAAHTDLAQERRRTQALLWLHEGESISDIAQRLYVSRQTLYNWFNRFQARHGRDLPARLADDDRSGRPRTARGVIDPLILEVLDQNPRDRGYRSTVWTAPLLQQYLRQTHQQAVSLSSVRLAMARLRVGWKRPRYHLSRRPATWRQAKGGSNAG
jgi:transposase